MRALALLLVLVGCRAPAPAPRAVTPDAQAAATPAIDEGAGKALVANNCVGCHDDAMVAQQRLTPKQWDAVLKKMQGWGAPIEPENTPRLALHLSARYGLQAGAYDTPHLATGDAQAQVDPVPDGAFAGGDARRGEALYHERCESCHAKDARGGPLGVNLADRYLLYRAEDFARLVRSGRGRMPAFPTTDEEVAHVLAFLRKS
jgi:mono/diheme cytochrome c family protein